MRRILWIKPATTLKAQIMTQAKPPKTEWRIFQPVISHLSLAVVGVDFGANQDQQKNKIEDRPDIYTVVNDSIGLKRRGHKDQLELKIRTDVQEESGVKGLELWQKYKVQDVKDVKHVLKQHDRWTDEVKQLVEGEGRKVEIKKHRADKELPDEGVTVEDVLLEIKGRQYRSFSAEGSVDKVANFLSKNPLGQQWYALGQQAGTVMTGYPGFLAGFQD